MTQFEKKMNRSQTQESISVSKDYIMRLQIGQYSDYSVIANQQIFHITENQFGQHILMLYACRFPSSKQQTEEF